MSAARLNQGQIRGDFEAGMAIGFERLLVDGLFIRTRSTVETETYAQMRAAPRLSERRRPISPKRMVADLLTARNKAYDAASAVDLDAWRRDQTGAVSGRIREHGLSASSLPYELMTSALTDNPTVFDGQNFFDTDHSGPSAQVNALAAAHIPGLAVVDQDDPTPEELAPVVTSAISKLRGFVDDEGRPVNAFATRFLVMAKPGVVSGALEAAIRANNLSGGQTNIVNPTGQNRVIGPGREVLFTENAFLTGNEQVFYILRLDGGMQGRAPFLLQEELAAEMTMFDNDREAVIANEATVYVKWQGAVIPLDWTCAVRCTISE